MAFCINCGQELLEEAKFCANCGKAVNNDNKTTQRKTVYEGQIHKCPNCGEVINSFVSNCPTCGYEIRGASNSSSIREFSKELAQVKSEDKIVLIIRSFPIPNTKEDIFEYMILASTNIIGEQRKKSSMLG